MLKSKNTIEVQNIDALTKDMLPLVVVMDSFLCWLAIARSLIQDVLAESFDRPHVSLSNEVQPRPMAPADISLVFSWTVRWPDQNGVIRIAQGHIAFELLLAMLQPGSIDVARRLQSGELQADPQQPVSSSMLGQSMKAWPHPIEDEVQMLCSWVYNAAWKSMSAIEAQNLQVIKPKAQA